MKSWLISLVVGGGAAAAVIVVPRPFSMELTLFHSVMATNYDNHLVDFSIQIGCTHRGIGRKQTTRSMREKKMKMILCSIGERFNYGLGENL